MIPVTKPFLPPLTDFNTLIKGVWDRNWLTNNGPLVNSLELKLKEYLNLNHLVFLTNGTIALQIAIKALNLRKKIITTPFSYIATTSSIVWEGCTPVFADIDLNTFNIDPKKIASLIDDQTEGILATHCFGNPCDISAIQAIADKYNLKVIYDAAHCFGVKYLNKSLLSFGDISTISFHATKLYHTVEGGALTTNSPEILEKAAFMRNFGHDGPEQFNDVGINGKNSELHAAMGIVNLRHADEILEKRKKQSLLYDQLLTSLNVVKQSITPNTEYNHAYYPVVFESEDVNLKMKAELEKNEIFPRRYFYPSLSSVSYTEGNTPIADDLASRILCLPLYHNLSEAEQEIIARILLRTQNYRL